MIPVDKFVSNLLNDLRVELGEEFDRNFERKSFFGVPWAPTRRNIQRGSLMIRTGDLRRSIISKVSGAQLRWSSSLPYASIHNEGGQITVTPKMKKYFWAKYYEAAGAIDKRKDGGARATQRNTQLSADAMYWKGLALMKVGSKLTIPKRQILGHHPQIDTIVRRIVDDNVQELARQITHELSDMLKR